MRNKAAAGAAAYLIFCCGLYVHSRADGIGDFPMLFFKLLDALTHQNQDVAVDRTPLIIGYMTDFAQHFFFNADGYTLDCHGKASKANILCVYFMALVRYNVIYRYIIYLHYLKREIIMTDRGRAYFVRTPRRLSDLTLIHLLRAEKPFQIVKTVELDAMDYENFITDLRADRSFLERIPEKRGTERPFGCIFVHQRGRTDGIMVVPTADGHVRWAAYWAG